MSARCEGLGILRGCCSSACRCFMFMHRLVIELELNARPVTTCLCLRVWVTSSQLMLVKLLYGWRTDYMDTAPVYLTRVTLEVPVSLDCDLHLTCHTGNISGKKTETSTWTFIWYLIAKTILVIQYLLLRSFCIVRVMSALLMLSLSLCCFVFQTLSQSPCLFVLATSRSQREISPFMTA